MEQETGEMHWSDGWMFKRMEGGNVRIRREVASAPADAVDEQAAFGIWSLRLNAWLRPADEPLAVLAFTSRAVAQNRAASHYGHSSYPSVVEAGVAEVRPFSSAPSNAAQPVVVEAEIPAAEWVSIIHHLGESPTAETFQTALALHAPAERQAEL